MSKKVVIALSKEHFDMEVLTKRKNSAPLIHNNEFNSNHINYYQRHRGRHEAMVEWCDYR